MRTTVTLDPDAEKLIRGLMQERGLSFKEAINDAIRLGLTTNKRNRRRKFIQKTYSLGAEQYFRWDRALATADALEDEELGRKLSLQK